MKISQLFYITEDPKQEHELLVLLKAAVKKVPNDIESDFEEESVTYPKGFFFNGKSSLFEKSGRCMADESFILDHADQEKVLLLAGGYDPDYEEFFTCLKEPEVLIKRSTQKNHYVVTYCGKRFELEREELQKLISDFHSKITTYNRISERKESHDDSDDEVPSWYRRSRRRSVEDDGNTRDLDESDFIFKPSEIWGGFMYDNLSHE